MVHQLINKFFKTQLPKTQSEGFMLDVLCISGVCNIKSGLDNFIRFPFKLLNLYEK